MLQLTLKKLIKSKQKREGTHLVDLSLERTIPHQFTIALRLTNFLNKIEHAHTEITKQPEENKQKS